ncbi:MAG: ABC transporter substrate-binding protein [Chloroflexi bacterium]|nr:ABC transporter substrate-binding protein [Chloroflexota bacterium]
MKAQTEFPSGLALLAAGVTFAVTVGCGTPAQPAPSDGQPQAVQAVKRGGVLVIPIGSAADPPSFDLHQESTSATSSTAGPLYDNLIVLDPLRPSEIVPDLAERWELSPDGKTYTFSLHKNVKFHNGNPLAAADVKFTLERVKDPPSGVRSPRRTAFDAVTSIETPNDYTVKLNLKRPSPSLLINLAQGWMGIYDKEWVEARGQDAPKKETMGTGPYKLKEYLRGTSVEVERNASYWVEGKPYLDGVKFLIIPDAGTRLAALRTGQLMMLDVSAIELRSLEQEMGDKLTIQRGVNLGFNSLSVNVKRKPFDDPRVREAVNIAIDRHGAVQVLAQGDGEAGGYMMPGGIWSLPQEELQKLSGYGKDKATDLERAKKLLAEAGYAAGFDARINTRNLQGYVDLSVFLIDQLKKVGLNVDAKFYETAQAYDLAEKGDFDLLPWTHSAGLDDPDSIYGEFYTCSAPRNWGRLCSAEVDALFERQSQEVDPVKRKALMLELERKAIPTASRIITHWSRFRNVSWSYIKNWVRHPNTDNNYRYRDLWLDR